MTFNHTVVAGTFDHLHSGHHLLLNTALNSSRRISLGLTTKNLTTKKPFSKSIQSYSTRKNAIHRLLNQPTTFFPLKNPLGSAPTNSSFDSIICTSQTLANVKHINQLRIKNHLQPLTPIIVNLLPASDKQRLSSTRIRAGHINRQGFAYQQIFSQKLTLPTHHRHLFSAPFSTLLTGSSFTLSWAGLKAKKLLEKKPPYRLYAVGDIAVQTLLDQNIALDIAIIDAKTSRQPYPYLKKRLSISQTIHNPASTITPDLISALTTSLKQPHQTLFIKGEEDLAVLPLILLSPLQSAIFYGQPNQGLVYIKVTENSKAKAANLLQKFT